MTEKQQIAPEINNQIVPVEISILNDKDIDETFKVPILTDLDDVAQLCQQKALERGKQNPAKLPVEDHLEFHDRFTPKTESAFAFKEIPYCDAAEGNDCEMGWNNWSGIENFQQVTRQTELDICKANIDRKNVSSPQIKDREILDHKPILFKKSWPGQTSEPTGLYYDEQKNEFHITSPEVIAVYYDSNGNHHFIYQTRRDMMTDSPKTTEGFVWRIRKADLNAKTKIELKKLLEKNNEEETSKNKIRKIFSKIRQILK